MPFASFHLDHVVSEQQGGGDELDNRAFACHWCNFNKGPNIAGWENGEVIPLFNPRNQKWKEHFTLDNGLVSGITAEGRVTMRLLKMNDIDRVELRRSLR
jgi:hypothetical protein